jgi:hypothetical protein
MGNSMTGLATKFIRPQETTKAAFVDRGYSSNRSEEREPEKTVDFRSQQVECYFITARIGFLPVTESVALPARPGEARCRILRC